MDKFGLDFSLLIAYLVPGSVVLAALSLYSGRIQQLLSGDHGGPSGSAVAALAVLALALGIVTNAITWAMVRPLIHRTGVKRVAIQQRPTAESFQAYKLIIEHTFRYYQCYSNLLTALLIFAISYLLVNGCAGLPVACVVLIVAGVLFCAARDSLERTYSRIETWLNKQGE